MIPREGAALFMTNSLLSRPETAGVREFALQPHNRGLRMLFQLKDAAADSVFPVLREVSAGAVVSGQETGTLYSGVWDVICGSTE